MADTPLRPVLSMARLLALVVGGFLGWALVVAASYRTAGITVAWRTTCGTITTAGAYTAPSTTPTTGKCLVIATRTDNGAVDTATATIASATVTRGRPFGPFGLWSSYTSVAVGPAPFTVSQNASDPTGIVTQIQAARAMRQKLVLAMTGGAHANYLTNGVFDLAKWKARQDRFNTAAIRQAVAEGVADGTIVGNAMLDEPEAEGWGGDGNTWGPPGSVTKPMLDSMATYAKRYFPTLPMGVNHGPTGVTWRVTERYRVVDYVLNQYAWRIGDLATWRDKVLALAQRDGLAVGFSLNIYGGGVQDRDGQYTCDGAGQGGIGPYPPTCQMPRDSLRVWGRQLAPAACVLLMWTYNAGVMAKPDNQAAFADLASVMAQQPATRCGRG